MKYRTSTLITHSLLTLIIVTMAWINTEAQTILSGTSGTIADYSINCSAAPGFECFADDDYDGFTFTIPAAGYLNVAGSINGSPVICCGNNYTGGIGTRLVRVDALGNVLSSHGSEANRSSDPSASFNFFVDCVGPGDRFRIEFYDAFSTFSDNGSYQYTAFFTPATVQDVEPNDGLATATTISLGDTITGNVGHGLGSNDDQDLYRLVVPEDGELVIDFAADDWFLFYIRNKTNSSNLLSVTSASSDTAQYFVSCVGAGDTLIIEVEDYSSLCADYQFSVALDTGTYAMDAEPNNTLAEATEISLDHTYEGSVGYGRNDNDDQDLYRLVVPEDGELVIDFAADDWFLFYIRNKTNSSNLLSVTSASSDTAQYFVSCVGAGDTLIIEVNDYSSACADYQFSIALDTGTYAMDVEPNNTLAQAIAIDLDQTYEGSVGYGRNDNDDRDLYRLVVPEDGELMIDFAADDWFLFYIRNKTNSSNLLSVTSASSDTAQYFVSCVGAGDTLVIAINDYTTYCADYQFSIALDTGTYAMDTEPNNTLAEATEISLDQTYEGSVGYGRNDNDDRDLYRLVVPEDGELMIDFAADDRFLFNVFNKTGSTSLLGVTGNVADTAQYILSCVGAGDTLVIAINDYTTYCADYQFSIALDTGTYAMDAEPNNTLVEATEISLDQTYEGSVGYGRNDNDDRDLYRLVVPEDGELMIDFAADDRFLFYVRNKTNSTSLLSVTSASSDTAQYILSCVGAGDTLVIAINDYTTYCADYQFSIALDTALLRPGLDSFGNGTLATAQIIPDDLYCWWGSIDYGRNSTDVWDYFRLGDYAVGDTLRFTFDQLASTQYALVLPAGSVSTLYSGSNNVQRTYVASQQGSYTLRISASACTWYEITFDDGQPRSCLPQDCIPEVAIAGPAMLDADVTGGISIETSGQVTVQGDVLLSAPTIDLKPGFEVPSGTSLQTDADGCRQSNE